MKQYMLKDAGKISRNFLKKDDELQTVLDNRESGDSIANDDNYRMLFHKMETGITLFQTIFDKNHEPVDYKVLDVNPHFAKIYGMNRLELIGKKISEIKSNNLERNKNFFELLGEVSKKRVPFSKELYDINTKRWYKVDYFSPNPGYSASVFSDITTRKMDEQNIAKMSHEFRTPINVIFGAVQLFDLYLENDLVIKKDKFKPHLTSMKQNCLRLLKLVNNMIDATKIDAGFYEPSFENQNIVEVIRRITMSVVEYANQKFINLSFDSTIEEMYVMCDVDMIERIMFNLISNAIKHTRDKISIRIHHRAGNVYISVSDNGNGIDKDKHESVFERYNQSEELLTRKSEGSGIGLSLTKALVQMHGGKISVNSKYEEGCEILLRLPGAKNINRRAVKNNYDYISQNNRLIEKMKIEFADIYK